MNFKQIFCIEFQVNKFLNKVGNNKKEQQNFVNLAFGLKFNSKC